MVNGILHHGGLLLQRELRIDQKMAAGDQKDKFLDAFPDLCLQLLIRNTVYAF